MILLIKKIGMIPHIMYKHITILLLFLFIVTGCGKKHPENVAIIARVGDTYLTDEDLKSYTPLHLSGENQKTFQTDFVRGWIKEKVLLQYFKRNKIQLDEKDLSMIEKYKFQLLYSHFVNSISPEITKPTDVEIAQYYEAHKDEYQRDEDEVHLVLLFLEQPNIGIQDDIKHSKSLMEVIEKNFLINKISNQIERNGDLGFIPVSQLRKEISRAVKRYKSGKISRQIKTKEGIYYIQVLDYQEKNTYRELVLIKDEIIHHISKRKFDEFVENIVQNESQTLIIDKFFDKLN